MKFTQQMLDDAPSSKLDEWFYIVVIKTSEEHDSGYACFNIYGIDDTNHQLHLLHSNADHLVFEMTSSLNVDATPETNAVRYWPNRGRFKIFGSSSVTIKNI